MNLALLSILREEILAVICVVWRSSSGSSHARQGRNLEVAELCHRDRFQPDEDQPIQTRLTCMGAGSRLRCGNSFNILNYKYRADQMRLEAMKAEDAAEK